ncbi:MAG: sporulation protein YabP [Clostridiales bacterium]|nr:sporulation protein YabP [Clostridiales bacterium]
MTEDKSLPKMPHNVILEDRKKLILSGVSDLDNFDESAVTVFTDMGELLIKGEDLRVNKLSVETGELSVEGKISSMTYLDDQPKSSGFFSRVFR